MTRLRPILLTLSARQAAQRFEPGSERLPSSAGPSASSHPPDTAGGTYLLSLYA